MKIIWKNRLASLCASLMLASVSASVDAANPEGSLDIAESQAPHQLTIAGWAFDRDDANYKLRIDIYVGGDSSTPGAFKQQIRADKSRQDIGKAFPGMGNYHGFDSKINIPPTKAGTQMVYVYACNDVGTGQAVELGRKQVNIKSSAPIQTSNNPQGFIDVVESNANNQLTVKGWAFDRDDLSHKLRIHVYVGGGTGSGAPSYEIKADKYRPDIENTFKDVGKFHGYDSTINVSRTGRQEVYLYALNDVGGGTSVELGHKTVNIKPISNVVPTFQQYQDTARQTVPAFTNAALTQRTGNERVDAGDVVTVLKKEGNAFFVDYPAGNTRKQRWVDKKIFEEPSINTKVDDALKYIASLEGRAMDYDGAYGAQCVDLIKYYYKYLGVANYARGNGKDYATNSLPPGWTRIKGAVPQKGDILVYTSGGGGYGHVAIAESTNVSWHQNFNGKYVRKISGNYNTIHVGYWGIIRPNF